MPEACRHLIHHEPKEETHLMVWVTLWQRVTDLKVIFPNSERKRHGNSSLSGVTGARRSMRRDAYLGSALRPTQNESVGPCFFSDEAT